MKKSAVLLVLAGLAFPNLLLATPLVVPDVIRTVIGSEASPTADISMAGEQSGTDHGFFGLNNGIN